MPVWNHVNLIILSNFEVKIIILLLATKAKMENGIAYRKNNMYYFILGKHQVNFPKNCAYDTALGPCIC